MAEYNKIKKAIEEYQEVAGRLQDIKKDVFGRVQTGEIGLPDGIPSKIKQSDMAYLVGCGSPTWAEYESAKSLPSPKVLQSLINLGYNANWILAGKGAMKLTDDWTLDKIEFNTALESVMEEVVVKGLKLPAEKISRLISLAYDDFRLHKNIDKLKFKIGEFIAFLS